LFTAISLKKYYRTLLFAIILYVTIFNVFYAASWAKQQSPEFLISSEEKELYDWINAYVPKHAILLADVSLSQRLTAYTHADTLFIDIHEKTSDEGLLTRNTLIAVVLNKEITASQLFYTNVPLPDSLDELVEEVKTNKESLLNRYQVTHLILDKETSLSVPAQLVFENEQYRLFVREETP